MKTIISPVLSVYLDMMRFGAALVVVFHHIWHIVFPGFPLPWPGHSAVVVFFVLSGFVIAHAVSKPGVTLHHYVTHRLLRIMPVTVAALLLSVLLGVLAGDQDLTGTGEPGINTPAFWQAISANLVFIGQSWMTLRPPYNLPFWSLNFEVWYYVIFGAAVFAPRGWRMPAIVLTALLAGPKILLLFPVWLLGVAIYRTSYRPGLAASRILFAVTTVLALLFIWLDIAVAIRRVMESHWPELMSHADGSGQFIGDFLLGLLVAGNFLSIGGMSNDLRFLLKLDPLIKYLSSFTFSIYLFHMPLFVLLWNVMGIRSSSAILCALGVTIYCLAELTERRTVFFRNLAAPRPA